MARVANRVQVAVSGTPGTGAVTLGSAVSGAQTFASAGITDGEPVEYLITDGAAWELGVGVYASTGPTLTRVSIRKASAGAAISATSAALVSIVACGRGNASDQTAARGLPVASVHFWIDRDADGDERANCGDPDVGAWGRRHHYAWGIRDHSGDWVDPRWPICGRHFWGVSSWDAARRLRAHCRHQCGYQEATVSAVTMRPGVLYWIVYQSNNNTVTLRGLNTTRLLGMASPAAAYYTSQFLQRSGTFGTLSSDESGQTYALFDTSSCALVWVRQ